ncbi:MAG TPA: rhomboid family intramembrane serine protease [Gaiellaceae bacterium]
MLPLRDNVPTRTFPVVTVGIIIVNVIVWIWEITGTSVDTDVIHYGYYPCKIDGPCLGPALHAEIPWYENTFTSMFMHGGWEHIIFNMLFLWIFGNNVEDALGRIRFLLWYLVAGVAATGAQTFVTVKFGTAQDASIPNIGASGAIAGVLGAYFLLLPRARVLTVFFLGFIFLREIRAVWFLGVWIALQIWQGGLGLTRPEAGGGVAFFAHIGGFAFGLLTIFLVAKRRPLQPLY